jgi:hypothetical protein
MLWLKQMFSDANGMADDARIAAFLLVLAFIVNSNLSVYLSPEHNFDAEKFGIGAGALAAGIGVWFGARKGN